MAIKLKAVLAEHGISLAELARAIDVSRSTLSLICNHGRWPKTPGTAVLVDRIMDELKARLGHEDWDAGGLFEEVADERCNARQPVDIAPAKTGAISEEDSMLLRKQGLTPAAKKHFGLFRDPFADDVQETDDVFVSPDIRYVREAMFQTAKHGGFLAVCGESGAGKSTLADDIEDRIVREELSITLIRPYVVGMEGDDTKGKRLKAGAILDAILRKVAPSSPRPSDLQNKTARAHDALIASHQAGNRHCLILDEAHRLAPPTLKHLKGFYELKLGHAKLLSIILIGQPELRMRLDERNPELREVTQRCEVVELPPLDARLEDYVAFKLRRIGKDPAEVFEPDALDAVRARLTLTQQNRRDRLSLLYPLAVNNLITGSLNLAAELGAPKVGADLVKEV
ncbi:AAA family ATPase [Methylocaldum sp.]|uniref:AAA family ATPase n=1 Tax=Methylocaldum sp. TaxID=1969727 RepID=UPI002D668D9A|nr:AAA family ATPase [Methylocaldum sp.]HYE35485.1 AAA family ATPase [Methylocaldum sp.]